MHDVDMSAALDQIDRFIRTTKPHHVVTADASMFVMAQADESLHEIIAHADLITPDSAGILWAAKRYGRPLRERVSGVEIVEQLCARSASHGYRIFFLGAAPGVAEQAAEKMRAKYPGAQFAGVHHGFFTEGENETIVDRIRESHADVLCVAFGIPRQEKWISANRDRLGVPVLIGVGGTLDVLSGNVKRAPRIMQRAKLEWLWRVLKNPRKLNKVLLLPRFVHLVRRSV